MTHIISALFIICAFVLSSGAVQGQDLNSPRQATTLVVGVNDDIYPYAFAEQQQKPAGLLVDYWQEIARQSNLTLQLKVVPRADLQTALANGDIDVIGGMSKTAEREQLFLMGPVLNDVYSNVFVHRDLLNIVNLPQLRPFLVGSLNASTNLMQLKAAVPGIEVKEYLLADQMYDAALRGEIKVFTGQDLLSPRYANIQQLADMFPLYRKIPLAKIELSYGLRRTDQALANRLLQAHRQLPAGFMEKLERRWLSGVKDENTLVLAMALGNPPLMYMSGNGQPQGLLVDIWNLWSERTGVPVAMLPDTARNGLRNLLQGRVDVHSSYPMSDDLPADVSPVLPIYRMYSSFYYKPGLGISSLDELKQPIGVLESAAYQQKLRHDHPALQIRLFDKLDDMQRAFENQEIAGFFLSDLVMQQRVLQANANAFERLALPRYQSELQVLVSHDNPKLLQQVRDGFARITQDDLLRLESQWLAKPEQGYFHSFRNRVPLSPEQQQWLSQHNSIRVGVMAAWHPVEFVDEDGQFKGVTQDVLQLLNRRLGTNLTPVPYQSWQELVKDFAEGKLDVVANMADNPARREVAIFSENFWPFQWAIVGNSHAVSINSLQDLAGQVVALEKDYDIVPLLQQKYPQIRLQLTDNFQESMQLLADGKVRYIIDSVLISGVLLRQPQYAHMRMHIPADMPATPSLLAVRKDWPLLLDIINTGVRTISEADRHEIRNRWALLEFSPDIGQNKTLTLVLQVMGAAILLFALVFIWNISLRREINLRRQMEQKMRFMATHDDLTQLANRALLQERLEQALLQHARHQEKLALLFIDLDGFKAVNDNHGHHVGDELLMQVAGMLKYCVRKSDTVARFGGDEFVILLTGLLDRDDAAIVAEKILLQLAEPLQLSVCQAQVGASIGIAMYPDDGSDNITLMKVADSLMYAAKQAGKGHYRFHSETVTKAVNSI